MIESIYSKAMRQHWRENSNAPKILGGSGIKRPTKVGRELFNDVHTTHCCTCACKYGEEDYCPVFTLEVKPATNHSRQCVYF